MAGYAKNLGKAWPLVPPAATPIYLIKVPAYYVLRFDAMLYSNLVNENSDAGHMKCLREPQIPHPCFRSKKSIWFRESLHIADQKVSIAVQEETRLNYCSRVSSTENSWFRGKK